MVEVGIKPCQPKYVHPATPGLRTAAVESRAALWGGAYSLFLRWLRKLLGHEQGERVAVRPRGGPARTKLSVGTGGGKKRVWRLEVLEPLEARKRASVA